MRGRVGRSGRRAYAYFLYRPDKILTEEAEKRLQAIKEFTELGAGFKLAMRDLEIRGAGNLLGAKQHGNISSVGFAMYCTMLEAAVAKARHIEPEEKPAPDPSIDLGVEAYIDDAYIPDAARKISVYQRLLQVKSLAALEDVVDELTDRFGTPTDAAEHLLRLAKVKEVARMLGIKSIVYRNDILTTIWDDDSKMAGWDMGAVSPSVWKRLKVAPGKPTTVRAFLAGEKTPILTFTEALLKEFSKRERTDA